MRNWLAQNATNLYDLSYNEMLIYWLYHVYYVQLNSGLSSRCVCCDWIFVQKNATHRTNSLNDAVVAIYNAHKRHHTIPNTLTHNARAFTPNYNGLTAWYRVCVLPYNWKITKHKHRTEKGARITPTTMKKKTHQPFIHTINYLGWIFVLRCKLFASFSCNTNGTYSDSVWNFVHSVFLPIFSIEISL